MDEGWGKALAKSVMKRAENPVSINQATWWLES